jgi:hypothetical protein
MADATEQLQINLKINEAIKERNALLERQKGLIIDQIALSRAMCDALNCVDTEQITRNIEATRQALQGLTQASDQAARQMGSTSEQMSTASKALAGLASGAAAAKSWWSGMGKVIGVIGGKLGFFVKGALSVIGALGRIAKAIISIPFKMLNGLIGMANQFARFTELSHALEDVREKFGDLGKGTGKILKESLRPMKTQFNQLTAAGHSFTKTFGRGPKGMAEALKFNAELMEKLNGGTEKLRNEIGQNVGALAIYRKGMGLTADQQATLILLADAYGKSITGVQHEFAKFSLGMGKRFGLDSKLIGQAMADMTANVGDFGTLSTKQLAQVATYTQQLGIETKALQGVIKKYDDFESAAQSAAMLNQTFGMQIDVLRMLKDEDPASRLSQLQKSFQATGKSYEQLSRAERRRLAELAGLDDKSAALAFSQGGLSKSYEEVQAAGQETEIGFKDINDTLKELAKNMKKVLEDPDEYTSFFDAFTKGFTKGVIQNKNFMGTLWDVRTALTKMAEAGRLVGDAFVETFPGVKQLLNSLSKFFKAGDNIKNIQTAFTKFFQSLQGGPKKVREAVGNLWQDLTGNLMNFFNAKGDATEGIGAGLRTFASTLGNVVIAFAQNVMKNVAKALRVVGQFFKNMKTMSFGEAFNEAMGTEFSFDAGGFLSESFGEAFSEVGDIITKDLWPAIKDAFLSMWDWLYNDVLIPFWNTTLKPWLQMVGELLWNEIKNVGSMVFTWWWDSVKKSFSEGNYGTSAAIFLAPFLLIFGPANMFSIAKLIVKGLGKGLTTNWSSIGRTLSGLGSRMGGMLTGPIGRSFGGLFARLAPKLLNPYVAIAAIIIETGDNASKQMERLGSESIEKYGMAATKSAAGLSGLFQSLTLGLLPDSMYDSLADWFAEFFGGGEQDGFIGLFKQNIASIFAIFTDLFIGVKDAFGGIWDMLMGLLTLDFGRVGLGVMKFFTGIGSALLQVGFTMWDSIIGGVRKAISALSPLLKMAGFDVDGALKKVDDFQAGMRAAAEDLRNKNNEMQNMKSETQLDKEAKAKSQQQAAAATAATPEEKTEERLSTLRAADAMLQEVEKLKGVEKRLEDAIKDIPTDDKIELIKSQTKILVENMNKTFDALKRELDNAKFDTFKADMFDNKIVSNIQNIVSIKEAIDKLAVKGPENADLEANLNKFLQSIETFNDIGLKIAAEMIKPGAGLGFYEAFSILMQAVTPAIDDLKKVSDSMKQIEIIDNVPETVQTKMTNLNAALQNFVTGIDSSKQTVQTIVTSTNALLAIAGQAKMDPFHLIDGINGAMQRLTRSSLTDPSIMSEKMEGLETSMDRMKTTINRFTTVLPENVLAKAEAVVQAINQMERTFSNVSNKKAVATAIKIGESFNGSGTVKFKHENININLAVKVLMSAEKIAEGVLKVELLNMDGHAGQKVTIDRTAVDLIDD